MDPELMPRFTGDPVLLLGHQRQGQPQRAGSQWQQGFPSTIKTVVKVCVMERFAVVSTDTALQKLQFTSLANTMKTGAAQRD